MSVESATHDLSLFKPHLKTSSSTTPSRRSPCSSSRSRRALLDNFFFFSCQSSSQRSSSPFRLYFGKKGDSRFQKKSSATPHNGEVVGSKSLVPLWWSATAWSTPGWLRGLRGGLLDSGDSTGWLSNPLRPSTSSIRAASLFLLAYSRQPIEIVALIQELQILLRKGAVETASQSPGFYESLPHPEGFGVVAPHH